MKGAPTAGGRVTENGFQILLLFAAFPTTHKDTLSCFMLLLEKKYVRRQD